MPKDNRVTHLKRIKPFVKEGEELGFVKELREKGQWPPRLGGDKPATNDHKVTTPFLVIPAVPADLGIRPLPGSKACHSQSIWIEEAGGAVAATPVIGVPYRIKCRIRNNGAFASYGGMVDFFINTPAAFNAAAGTNTSLPAFAHSGFSVLQGQEIIVECPKLWTPTNDYDLKTAIVVHAYDPFADMLQSRFDALNDRHVGRHDFTSDFYVRDWTDSASAHDDGREPSSNNVFYTTSDIWNRRSNAPGPFVNDRPENQNPQAGNGAAGDNFVFARISRNNAATQETVKAHFMVAEFGTGSPYVDCSPETDPSVTFMPGETSKIISLPWHLHPTSSTHLCLGVQIYSDADPYVQPGLLGNTPGWPTTDMMVIRDNNKAQRNMSVWDGIPETEGMFFGIICNAATFTRDLKLSVYASKKTMASLQNPMVVMQGGKEIVSFKPGETLTLANMLPGERRWVGFAFDSFSPVQGESLMVSFNEKEGRETVNGFAFELRGASVREVMTSALLKQSAVFYRMAEGMQNKSAFEGLQYTQRLLEGKADTKTYIEALPKLLSLLESGVRELAASRWDVQDLFGYEETLRSMPRFLEEKYIGKALAAHSKLLHQADALLTYAVKSKGDEAAILFTVRLQRELFKNEKLRYTMKFEELLQFTCAFIHHYKSGSVKEYPELVRKSTGFFKVTLELFRNGALRTAYEELLKSLSASPAEIQKAHLHYLHCLQLILGSIKTSQEDCQTIGKNILR